MPPRSSTRQRWLANSGFARLHALLLALALVVGFAATRGWRPSTKPPSATAPTSRTAAAVDPQVLRDFTALEARENELERESLAQEIQAQQYAAVIEDLWDALNRSPDGLAELVRFKLGEFSGPPPLPTQALPHGIRGWRGAQPGSAAGVAAAPPLTWASVREAAQGWHEDGWRLTQSEWRNIRFAPGRDGQPAQSDFEVRLDLERTNETRLARAQISGRIRISWGPAAEDSIAPRVGRLEVVHYAIDQREGPPAFRLAWQDEYQPFPRTSWIDPVILRSAVADRPPEILLVARNLILRRGPDGAYQAAPLTAQHPGLLFTALLADFTGDGRDDLLMAVRTGLTLLVGNAQGTFDSPARPVWQAPARLEYAQAFTTGDFDGDGHLDVFLGQYRAPYEGGQMPRPYFDARDGPPAYLLLNRGDGTFEDRTEAAGLAAKRHRRSYGASFVDLDGDDDLDLLVTSDFAGVDVYENDGRGGFRDRTESWLQDPRGFGMAHTLSDLNSDGRLDFLMLGMPQATAERLDAAGWERAEFETWKEERAKTTFGNRLFLGQDAGYLQPPRAGAALARTGWAWTAAAGDFDLDRFPDLAIANGHETRSSVRDFEREFWTHDIYVGDSTPKPAVDAYFAAKFARVRSLGWSYGGYDKNRCFLGQGGTNFLEVGHLFGLALEADSRNALAADLDGDGDLDLLITTFEIWPRVRQTLRIYENTLERTGHWIAFRLPHGPGVPSPVGATVRIRDAQGVQARTYVTGEGYRAQGEPRLHFGLGDQDRILEAEIRWPDGRFRKLSDLAADREHPVPPPGP